MANNITEVRLLNVPLENDYLHTLYFASESAQNTYFKGKTIANGTFTNLSYQRKDNLIRIPKQMDEIIKCNYVMYKNSAYSNKWFYAFVTDMTYINDERTDVIIETDVIQTWLFDYTVKPSFVEREHVTDDIMGNYVCDEGLQLGEYICNMHNKADFGGNKLSIVVGTTKTPEGENVRGTLYDNVYSGLKYYTFEHSFEGRDALETWIAKFDEEGASESIVCMFLAPQKLAVLREDHTIAGSDLVDSYYINSGEASAVNKNMQVSSNQLNGYDPRNKKLLTYPYRYLMVANNNGVTVPYKYENFYEVSGNTKTFITPKFIIEGCLTPGCSVRMVPLNYNGITRNDEEGINLGKYPALNWTSDVFTNWLTQNAINIGVSVASDLIQIAGGLATIGASGGTAAAVGTGTALGGVQGIASTIGEIYKASKTPPQSHGNTNCGDVITASAQNDFHFYDMTIKKEFAQIIDEYFDMFGYKVNRVKTPNKNHRENYWFTKCIDVNIDGAIPMKDLRKIKDCYNKGITFWRSANIGNYGVTNNVVQ